VKYSYLPRDTFKTYVEMHVTSRKLTFKVSGYCRQAYMYITLREFMQLYPINGTKSERASEIYLP